MVLDEPKDSDETYEVEGLTYLVDKGLAALSGDVTVDYVDNGWQQGFMVSSSRPLEGGGCPSDRGPGESCSC